MIRVLVLAMGLLFAFSPLAQAYDPAFDYKVEDWTVSNVLGSPAITFPDDFVDGVLDPIYSNTCGSAPTESGGVLHLGGGAALSACNLIRAGSSDTQSLEVSFEPLISSPALVLANYFFDLPSVGTAYGIAIGDGSDRVALLVSNRYRNIGNLGEATIAVIDENFVAGGSELFSSGPIAGGSMISLKLELAAGVPTASYSTDGGANFTEITGVGGSVDPGGSYAGMLFAVPEPGMTLLLVTGLFGLAWSGRRRRQV